MPRPERDDTEFPAWAGQLATVVDYQDWKRRMAKKKKNGNKPIEEMNEKDMFMEIMSIYTRRETTDAQRRKIYEAVVRIMSEPDKPDDEKPGA
jgi:hypothetical protein